ncbi:MAG: phage BR0599 family protein [Opitutaceae bacterium]|nr:phage BR0599 family protein [Opitutaceae bacterium]
MINLTFNAEPHWLVTYVPDAESVYGSVKADNRHTVGLSMREQRQKRRKLLQCTLSYSVTMNAAEASTLRSNLPIWLNRRFLVPFWPCMRVHSEQASGSVSGRIRIWWNDLPGGQFEVRTNANPAVLTAPLGLSVLASTRTAPVMRATFDSMPEFGEPNTDGDVTVTFRFVEDATASTCMELPAVSFTYGAMVNGANVPKLTVPVDWDDRRAEARARVIKEQIGLKMVASEAYHNHEVRMVHHFSAKCFGSELQYVLGLFKTCAGSIYPFYAPDDKSPTGVLYGRFDSDEIEIEWEKMGYGDNEEIAIVRFDFQTLPSEEVIPVGETYGVSIGPEPETFLAIKVTNDSGYAWCYTDNPVAVTNAMGTFQPLETLEIGDIEEELNMQISDTTLRMEDFPGNPFRSLKLGTGDLLLTVTIIEGRVANPALYEVMFIGDAVTADDNPPILTIKLRDEAGAFLDIEGPRMSTSKSCHAVIFDQKCKLTETAFKLTRTLVSFSNGIAEFSGGSIASGHLALGQARRKLATGDQDYHVTDNYTLPNGNVAVVIQGDILPAPTGAEALWELLPGCDGAYETCQNKFNNLENFHAYHRMPDVNPSMVPVAQSTRGGKK